MKINYSEFVKSLAKNGDIIKQELSGKDAHLWHMASCILGEAGELFDAIKRKVIYRKELDIENVVEELGDLEFCLEGLRGALGLSREECIDNNIRKLSKRYEGIKYSDVAAQNRVDKK